LYWRLQRWWGSTALRFWRWWRKLQRRCGFDCFPFLAMVKEAAMPVWVWLLSVNNRWFDDQLFPCRYENRIDPWLSAFLSFSVYIFLTKKLVSYRDETWADVSVLLCIFFFCSVFFALFFFGLIALFFWVFCCCWVLWIALFLGLSSFL